MPTTLTARRLLTDSGQIDLPIITIDEDGLILRIDQGAPDTSPAPSAATSTGTLDTLTAAFLDIHVHGACSYDFMAATQTEIAAVGTFLAARGVAHYLPTTVTAPLDLTLRALENLANAIESPLSSAPDLPLALPVGIHLEGPFVSHVKRGVHPLASILEPSVALFDRFQQAARGHIRLLTLAPELPHALELIEHASAAGIRVTLGHSNATAAETLAAVAAGATSSTHLFNAMRALDHREPGILGTLLDRDDVYAEAICDGVHVDPAMIRLWLRMKGEQRAILVTDGMSATGMPDGTYTLGDLSVEVKDGVCLSGQTLAGSVLTMDKAVANLRRFTGSSLATAVHLASRNPAHMLGMPQLSTLAPGHPANFNIYNQTGERTGTILNGRLLQQ
ncbi:MAG TPA: N-acetylglucosamine-6-phosphate deacetylase [Granulicella sp.]|jgi:N-acetylglucosamine-6-phosphate deacetylase|nr:N-acetylglucosamine-6-phosphate deacetylase [Granulicella sp.]